MFALGIPRCNEPAAIFAETIAAVRASRAQPERGLIIDNGDVRLGHVDEFAVLRFKRNIGCAGAWNTILRAAFMGNEFEHAIVLNADCAVAPDTFEKLLASKCGVALAMGFSCFRIDRVVWQAVGPFDEMYYPCYWEDADYRVRLRHANFTIDEWPFEEVARPSFGRALYSTGITHGWRLEDAGYQGWKGDKAAWFQARWCANRDHYVAKWGGMPGEEKFSTPFNK